MTSGEPDPATLALLLAAGMTPVIEKDCYKFICKLPGCGTGKLQSAAAQRHAKTPQHQSTNAVLAAGMKPVFGKNCCKFRCEPCRTGGMNYMVARDHVGSEGHIAKIQSRIDIQFDARDMIEGNATTGYTCKHCGSGKMDRTSVMVHVDSEGHRTERLLAVGSCEAPFAPPRPLDDSQSPLDDHPPLDTLGLENPGENICFINALVQVFRHVPSVRAILDRRCQAGVCDELASFDRITALRAALNLSVPHARAFRDLVWDKQDHLRNKMFREGDQSDVSELFTVLVQDLTVPGEAIPFGATQCTVRTYNPSEEQLNTVTKWGIVERDVVWDYDKDFASLIEIPLQYGILLWARENIKDLIRRDLRTEKLLCRTSSKNDIELECDQQRFMDAIQSPFCIQLKRFDSATQQKIPHPVEPALTIDSTVFGRPAGVTYHLKALYPPSSVPLRPPSSGLPDWIHLRGNSYHCSSCGDRNLGPSLRYNALTHCRSRRHKAEYVD